MIPNKLILYAGGVLAILAVVSGGLWYTYNAGAKNERTKYETEQRILAEAQQAEKDKADAQYRGQILATQQRERDLNTQLAGTADSLRKLRIKLQTAGACTGLNDAGTDWLSIIGESWAEYSELGKEAARLADKVGGLQGYIRAIQKPK